MLPTELKCMITEYLEKASEVKALSLTSKRFRVDIRDHYWKMLAQDKTVYPTRDSVANFISLITEIRTRGKGIHKITLVNQWLKEHEYGYNWAWEDLQNVENFHYTSQDLHLIHHINQLHADAIRANGHFINGGNYRLLLGELLALLPDLKVIQVRGLRSGEHVPGWKGPQVLKQLSFYQNDLKVNEIFYGGWLYDEKHLRVTRHVNEFGEQVEEEGAGPQASFSEDLKAAIATSGTNAKDETIE